MFQIRKEHSRKGKDILKQEKDVLKQEKKVKLKFKDYQSMPILVFPFISTATYQIQGMPISSFLLINLLFHLLARISLSACLFAPTMLICQSESNGIVSISRSKKKE